MPIERPDRQNPRPLKPTLASTRTAKTPLTPRLAVAPTASSTVSAPSTRAARSSVGSTPRAAPAVHETVTPVKAFLSSNVTPRSSSRKSRVGVDSASSTPNGTPSATSSSSRPSSTVDFAHKSTSQLGVRPRSTPGPSSSHTTPTPRLPLSGIYNHSPSETGSARGASPLFFHANDARPHEHPAPTSAPLKKTPTFFYADGKQDDTLPKHHAPSPPLSSVSRSRPEPKFFHADSVLDRPRNLTPPPMSASPELLPPPIVTTGPSLRPASPTKDFTQVSYRKGVSQAMRPALNRGNSGNSALSILGGQSTPDAPEITRRRSSTASSLIKQRGHAKSSSLSSIDSVASQKKMPSNEPTVMTPSPLHTANRVVSNSTLSDNTASAPSPRLTTFSGLSSPVSASPTKNDGKSALETMNELAANARRERKVLDLEISNSSLLAINRSLEKEIRKQKAEIRRFRRMSRAQLGTFTAETAGSPIETSAIGATHIGDLSDMSEGDEVDDEPEEEEEDPESSDVSFDEGSLSPSAQLERDESHRLRDEKRLQLDLSKHRDMLVDSQKMNQSLKKCLGWTEQLIKDGQKALAYKVNVSDVRLGGRVLVAEDDNGTAEAEESKGLLSPWSPLRQAVDALESPFFPNPDRDSGVDLEGLESIGRSHDESQATSTTEDDPDQSISSVQEFRPRLPGQWISYANIKDSGRSKYEDLTPLASPFEERIRHLHASIDALEAS